MLKFIPVIKAPDYGGSYRTIIPKGYCPVGWVYLGNYFNDIAFTDYPDPLRQNALITDLANLASDGQPAVDLYAKLRSLPVAVVPYQFPVVVLHSNALPPYVDINTDVLQIIISDGK